MLNNKIVILGAGNIGSAIADGILASGLIKSDDMILTRRELEFLESYKKLGITITDDNRQAVRNSEVIIISVEPQQIDALLDQIKSELQEKKHTIISIVTGVSINQMEQRIGNKLAIVRAMPNTAISIGESMTCIAADPKHNEALKMAITIFDTVGRTILIEEELMSAATALGACGIAFFLRAIRAASQGGIEIGFHSDKALEIAAQTAKGAASLLLKNKEHPEFEIDKVTTPRGVTISGLNQMEHQGFSSAMIKGIVVSAEKAAKLYHK
jgi:pyrroline-5-carboxylate reductase